jgi:hypothetical protein
MCRRVLPAVVDHRLRASDAAAGSMASSQRLLDEVDLFD